MLRVLQLYYKVASSQLPAPQIAPRTKVVLQSRHSRLHFAHSTRTISAKGCAGQTQIALSPAFRALDTHDLRRGLRRTGSSRTLACISRTRHARSPQRVARDPPRTKVVLESRQFSSSSSPKTPRAQVVLQSRHFSASSSTDCSAYYSGTTKSPVLSFQLHRLLRVLKLYCKVATLACISRTRHARSPQSVAPDRRKLHSRLHFAHSTRTISAEGCAGQIQIALSPAFRALDTHDLRRGLPATKPNRTLACISRTRHARSPQRVATDRDKSHSGLHFARLTRTISAEGCVSWRSGGTAPGLKRES